MFAKIRGRRTTALATTLAVVVGLAITPAFTATAAEGDEPVVIPQVAELLPDATPVASPPAAELPAATPPVEAAPPVETAPAEELPATPPSTMRTAPMDAQPLAVVQPAGITPASIPSHLLGQSVDIQFATTAPHDHWRGTYLSGIEFGASVTYDGRLSGTFFIPGVHVLRVEALNADWEVVASNDYTFNVIVAVTSTTLPDATVGTGYSETLGATRGTFWFTHPNFSITEGSLPPGVSLNAFTGELSGTVVSIPASPTTYKFSVTFNVSTFFSESVDSIPQPLSITVGYPAPVVTTTALPVATVGAAFPATRLRASGDGTITWSATGLPAGLLLDPATGRISGTPHYNATFGASATVPVTVTASNGRSSAPQALTLTVNTPAPIFGSRVLPAATVGALYDQQLPVTGGYGVLDYRLVGGTSLPAGLELTADGRIYGTPLYNASSGASTQVNFRVNVEGTAGADRQGFVFDLLTPAPVVTTTTLAAGWWKQPYSQPILTSGPGVTVTVAGLPAGLAFDGTSIVGKTRITGTHVLRITAVNTAGEVRKVVSLTINDKPDLFRMPVVTLETGEEFWGTPGFVGEQVALTLGADAPAGMTVDEDNRIDWRPTAPGVYTFTITATNPAGSDTQEYTFRVFDAPTITQGDLAPGAINMPYRQELQHDGTNAKFKIVRGALPDGLRLTKAGVIVGAATEAGSFSFKVRATNPVDTDSAWFNLTVLEPVMSVSASTVIRGNSLTVSGSGYLPGDTLELWLHSTPTLLGKVTAIDGSFTRKVVIPAGTAAGLHHLVVVGAQSGTHSVRLTIALPAPAAPSAPQSSVQPSETQQAAAELEESTTVSDSTEIEEVEAPAEEEAEPDLETLDVPAADGEKNLAPVADWTGLMVGAFAFLLAALLGALVLWLRRRTQGS